MPFTFTTKSDGRVFATVEGEHDTLNDALNDIFSSLPPMGWVGDGPSTYWIDRGRRQFEEARASGSVERFAGGNDTQLQLIDGAVEARYDYSNPDEPSDVMPVDEFVSLLDEWRVLIEASAARATSPLPETYRRNPGIPTGSVQLDFDLREDSDGLVRVIALINRFSLVSLITVFEALERFDVVGGYGGLVPASHLFGDVRRYFLPTVTSRSPTSDRASLLGCEDCGDVDCWPLTARIDTSEAAVTWSSFAQSQRPDRSYDGFGPFVFERGQYGDALDAMIKNLDLPSTRCM